MPSGNAIFTYTGKEPSIEIQGVTFLKDQPKHLTDNGVIAVCARRGDFSEAVFDAETSDADTTYLKGEDATLYAMQISPAKPKKAKTK